MKRNTMVHSVKGDIRVKYLEALWRQGGLWLWPKYSSCLRFHCIRKACSVSSNRPKRLLRYDYILVRRWGKKNLVQSSLPAKRETRNVPHITKAFALSQFDTVDLLLCQNCRSVPILGECKCVVVHYRSCVIAKVSFSHLLLVPTFQLWFQNSPVS